MVREVDADTHGPREAMKQVIARAGFDPDEFVIAESPVHQSPELVGGTVMALTLQKRGTSIRHTYAVSATGPWLFAPFADLTAGKFGRPR